MSSKMYLSSLVMSIAAAAAQAHEGTWIDAHAFSEETPIETRSSTQPGLTRAEVLADLQLYRESGFAELDRAETPAWESQAYKEAAARYAALRESPRYAQLVQEYGGFIPRGSMALSRH